MLIFQTKSCKNKYWHIFKSWDDMESKCYKSAPLSGAKVRCYNSLCNCYYDDGVVKVLGIDKRPYLSLTKHYLPELKEWDGEPLCPSCVLQAYKLGLIEIKEKK